ncbi:prepilin peptidase [Bacillus timonensis]|nr:prepilin peptidase [Bacillus timonensis]
MIYTILILTITTSLFTDIRQRKILNIVTFPTIIIGFIFYTITNGLEGFLFSGKGFLVGLGLLLIPYLLGGMGAGDVKLMAAIGALTGVDVVLQSFLYTALIGGLIALILIVKKRGIRSLFFSPKHIVFNLLAGNSVMNQDEKTKITFPYGVPIALGTLLAVFIGGGIG